MTRGGRHPPMLRARLPFLLAERLFTYLDGIDARDWWRLLRENRFAVDPVYWPRAARVSYASARTSAYRASEDRKYGRAVAGTEIQPPLFVLGHARSGTSYLHRLLAMDDRFAYPNQYQTNHPHTFLTTETRHADRMAAALLGTRVADNMAGGVTLPAEDEFALSLLTRCSPLLGWTFPRHWDRYLAIPHVPGRPRR
jgi:omega-hydroxy-beta-dihydromenaquinone-9 sulfotransferase